MTYDHRLGRTNVTVLGVSGAPLANARVEVEQVSHQFGFGNIGFDFVALANRDADAPPEHFGGASYAHAEALVDPWFRLFNWATLPFYWRGFEPEPGHPHTERLLAAARWFVERGAVVKGHPLLWHTLAPEWLMPLGDAEVEHAIRARITRDVTDFAGVVDLWDAINEAVILPVFTAEENAVTRLAQTKGRVEMVRLAFETAREANPSARLVLNDFDLSADYEHLIEECLAAGIAIDAIGVQTHMHQGFRGEDQIRDILDRFGRFGLPVQMTETTLVSGHLMPPEIVDLNDYQVESWPTTPAGEERQADEVARHYRTVVDHPAVESLTYWGLADEGSWLGAPSGFVRLDGTLKPAFHALEDLIKGEWWLAPTTMTTDDAGRVTVEGWGGEYRIAAGGAGATVAVRAGETGAAEATLA